MCGCGEGRSARNAEIAQLDPAAHRSRLLNEIMLELHDQGRQLSSPEDVGVIGTLERVQTELAATRNQLNLIRTSRAWRARSKLRKLLGMPTTLADV